MYRSFLLKVFVEEPSSKNASMGELAKFNCSVTGPYLFWKVNGSSSDSNINDLHNIEEDYSVQNGLRSSVLIVPCTSETNNTWVQCVTYEAESLHYSNTSMLMVQG